MYYYNTEAYSRENENHTENRNAILLTDEAARREGKGKNTKHCSNTETNSMNRGTHTETLKTKQADNSEKQCNALNKGRQSEGIQV